VTVLDLETTTEQVRRLMRRFLESYASSSPVRTVAVVGNAPLEPNAERAAAIDGADLVIRVNSFVLDMPGAAPCLGTKVDAVVVNRATRLTPWFLQRYRARAFLQSDTATVHLSRFRRRPAEHWPADLGVWQVPNASVVAELRDLIWADAGDEPVDPTTGTLAAWLAYLLFPEAELRLTGFSYLDERRPLTWEHHFGGTVPVSQAHRVDREGALLNSWLASGRAVALP
jgi:Glycosyltransferase family 29 (sialyltransferase)